MRAAPRPASARCSSVSKVTADVKAGEYTFYCSVPGHRQGGKEGKLTVK